MSPGAQGCGCSFGSHMVSQGPKFDNATRKKKARRENQVLSRKSGIIRPDKRKKPHYF